MEDEVHQKEGGGLIVIRKSSEISNVEDKGWRKGLVEVHHLRLEL